MTERAVLQLGMAMQGPGLGLVLGRSWCTEYAPLLCCEKGAGRPLRPSPSRLAVSKRAFVSKPNLALPMRTLSHIQTQTQFTAAWVFFAITEASKPWFAQDVTFVIVRRGGILIGKARRKKESQHASKNRRGAQGSGQGFRGLIASKPGTSARNGETRTVRTRSLAAKGTPSDRGTDTTAACRQLWPERMGCDAPWCVSSSPALVGKSPPRQPIVHSLGMQDE